MTNGPPEDAGASLAKLTTALGDPLGRRILRHCDRLEAPASPRELAEALDAPRAQVDRHVALLVAGGALRAIGVADSPARVYASALGDDTKWIREVLETSREVDEKDGEA